jgi:hypothetical protein
MRATEIKQLIKECVSEVLLNEMHYPSQLNVQYYAGHNLKIPTLSKNYEILYRRRDGGFYTQAFAKDADMFDHYAYIIKHRLNTSNQHILDNGVYTKPDLDPRDKEDIEKWSQKEEVQKRREFEKRNFPMKKIKW